MALKLLIIISNYPPGPGAGMERNCQRLARGLGERGHQVSVLTLHVDSAPEIEEEAPGVKVYRMIKPMVLGPMWGISYRAQVGRFMKQLAPAWEIALCQQIYLHSVSAAKVCRKLQRPWCNRLACAGSYGDIAVLKRHRFGRRMLKKALSANAHFALSNELARELHQHKVPPEKIWRYPNFVDRNRFFPKGAPLTGEFVYLGRFDEQKNIPALIEAFTNVWMQNKLTKLRIVGGGPAESQVRRLAHSVPAANAISVEEWTGEPEKYYRRAFAVVTATRGEGLSNVMLEAMACGAPVIAPDVSGMRDLVDRDGKLPEVPAAGFLQGEGGLLVPPNDPRAIAAAMTSLLREHGLRQFLSERAAAVVKNHFDRDKALENFEHAMETIRDDKQGTQEQRGFSNAVFEKKRR